MYLCNNVHQSERDLDVGIIDINIKQDLFLS